VVGFILSFHKYTNSIQVNYFLAKDRERGREIDPG
jgi:hypothetical protein